MDKRVTPIRRWQLPAAVAGLLLLLAACAGFDPRGLLPQSAVTVVATATAAAIPSPTLVTIPFEGETPILMCTPPACEPGEVYYCEGECPGGCGTICATPTPAPLCTPPACAAGEFYFCPTGDCPGGCGTTCATPTPITGSLAPAPTTWEGLEGWLPPLWRSNVNPAAVRAALQQSGVQRGLDDWRAADLDGDLRDEWVLVLYDQSLPSVPFGFPGDLWVVNENGVIFRYYNAPSSDIYEFIAPRIVDLVDVTGDGRPEIIADAEICGAHTCFGNYRIIGQTAAGLADLVRQPADDDSGTTNTISVSYPDTRVADVDDDGLAEFIVHGGTIGSVGAGIVRPRSEIWGWDGTAVTLQETVLDPTDYRHHVLYEANDRLAAGDLDGALALYEAAINDPALRSDAFAQPSEETYAAISQFAAFRLILIDLRQGNTERAASRLAWLQATYPDTAAAQGAAALVAGWTGAEGEAALCGQIEAALAERENPTGPLADLGYGNPSLGAADFCP